MTLAYKDLAKRRENDRRFHARNRERVNVKDAARKKRLYAENPTYREAILQRNARWREANREKLKTLKRAYYYDHREQILEDNERRIFVSGMYMGVSGMTRKQRIKFHQELEDKYGKTDRS